MNRKLAVFYLSFSLGGFGLAFADNPLPQAEKFSRYEPMLKRSPFAVASAGAPVSTADFSRDLYLANAALSETDNTGFVTVASTTDRNFKEYLSTKGATDGFAIVSIQWSDKVGETKATISKDGQVATLSFNEAVLSQTIQNQVAQNFQQIDRSGRGPVNLPMPLPRPMAIPTIPTPPPRTRGMIRRGNLPEGRQVPRVPPRAEDDDPDA